MLKSRVELNARTVPVAVALLLAVEVLDIYQGWRVLLVGLAFAWLIAYFWARSLARQVRLKRELRFGWLQVGDRLTERLTLKNGSRFPALWLEIQDFSTLPNHWHGRSLSVGQSSSVRWFRDTICSTRGLFSLGPVHVRTGDPLGLYTVELEYPTEVPVLVLPQAVPLPPLTLATGGQTEEGRVTPHALDRTVSAGSVREYLPEDRHHWIHWPTSARRNELFVRVFDSAPAGDLWIVLDLYEGAQFGEGYDSTQEHAVVLAASLAHRSLFAGRKVGLVSANHELVWLAPNGGEYHRWRILHSLALASESQYRLEDVLLRLSPVLARDASLVVITADVEPRWIEALLVLMRRGTTATVMMLDSRSFGGAADPTSVTTPLEELRVSCHMVTAQMLKAAAADLQNGQFDRDALALEPSVRRPYDSWQVVL